MNRFYKFCEETTFNGLTHVNSNKSKFAQLFWVVAFSVCSLTVTTLLGVTLAKYRSKPTGIDQQFVQAKTMLPKLAMCSYWIVLSSSEIKTLNMSKDLAKVIQWRIEQPYHVGITNPEQLHTPALKALLRKTKPEYDALMARGKFKNFDKLMYALIPKNHQREVIMKTKSGGQDNDFWFHDSKPDVITYAKDYMDFFNFYCKILVVPDTDKLFLTLNPPSYEELYQQDIDDAAIRLLPYSRSVTLRQFDGTVVSKIRPGYQYYVSYRKR